MSDFDPNAQSHAPAVVTPRSGLRAYRKAQRLTAMTGGESIVLFRRTVVVETWARHDHRI